MERPEPGLPLLRAVLKQIDEHPETWNQGVMAQMTACGTSHCIAGHAVTLRGHRVSFDRFGSAYTTMEGDRIWSLAMHELELTSQESDDLFDGYNSREAIQRIAESIALARGETL